MNDVACVAGLCYKAVMTTTALRTETVRARIDPRRKQRAEAVLDKLGIAPSQAINMLYAQINGMPFDLRVPTRKTKDAMEAVREGNTHKVKNAEELFKELAR